MAHEFDEISLNNLWVETLKHDGTCVIPAAWVADQIRAPGTGLDQLPGLFQRRPLVYMMLMHQLQRLNIDLRFGKRVVEYAEDADRQKAWVVTEEGERFEADVVVAADGVGTKSRPIVGGQVKLGRLAGPCGGLCSPSITLTRIQL